ncbi:type VI secretion system contractile sheath large subunit [Desulfoluna spongiiphila]|uniref:Type VI secretion system protein ImpC n=1 Tax=Desulfoluna spongiiphila TaxID=419481 RepID=A0A1G5E0R6_9BACT|nr:type VI secretion system contractile sheath large subunit [Desulfoluna spongiiphila]SCY20663.1 type VI secretion system protein ImpC [Desulfoluna spongiiphila]VVS91532.1 type vi secretion protein evpb/vc a0108 tail sheath [Desulfoluna spongiiphila]
MSEVRESVETPGAEAAVESVSLLDDIIESTHIKPEDDAYALTMQGLHALIAKIASPDAGIEKVTKSVVDDMIAELDRQISLQLDEIIHHEAFQKVESLWRSLKFLVDRTDFRENNKLEILNVTKEELLDDFEDAPEVVKSGLYKRVYTEEYGQFGGEPYATMIGNYEFGSSPQDIKLLGYLGSVAAMAHAPFIGAVAPSMFGLESFAGLSQLKDLRSLFEGPQYARWKSLRESEDARYLGLVMPRFLLRLPYGKDTEPVKSFDYEEDVSRDNENYLWGNVSFAFASKFSESFARYRWCTNIIGPKGGGAVEDLPLHFFEDMGAIQNKIPTEVLLSERREFELAEEGFIGLSMRKGSDNAAFFSANSIQKPKKFPNTAEGKAAETNYRLGTQLPYMLVINRLAHYLKVIQRENIGVWKERVDLQRELNDWIRQYVVDMENPLPGVRSRRPLRKAEIIVDDVPGEPGWYKVGLKVCPHFKYMGASFTLSLVGKLDKE